MDRLAAELFLVSYLWDTASVTLFRTAVERASCGVPKLLRAGGVDNPILLDIVPLAVVDGLFDIYGSGRWDELF